MRKLFGRSYISMVSWRLRAALQRRARNRWDRLLYQVHPALRDGNVIGKLLIVAGVLLVGVLATWQWDHLRAFAATLRGWRLGRAFVYIGLSLLTIHVAEFLWRVVLVLRYRPAPPCDDRQLPVCSVIIPAYNEGRHVLETIRSVAASDYPTGKLQIIAIDDGSADDTWTWMLHAADELPGRVEIIRQPSNCGKRHALYEGFRRSRGTVFVTIDSDSSIEPQTLRRLVSPFRDPRVGGVAGNIRVLNRRDGFLPKMLDVSFAYSFDFLRASQSMVNAVLCTPGALSAYRRTAVEPHLDAWLGQTFCRRSARIGEDRAMTNIILRAGYHVTFQRNAVAHTNVPTGYRGLCKMFTRWGRSNVRETLVLQRFVFRRFREGSAVGARINHVLAATNLLSRPLMLLGAMVCLLWQPGVHLTNLLLGSVVTACVPAGFYAIRHRTSDALWAFAYGAFFLFGLAWIQPFALLTCHRSGWLTREPARSAKSVARPAALRPATRTVA